ncbi:ATP-binding cassette domain-containing protein [Fictibacillus sp. Mic-4]|uniref:ATP-binding cassette domain-containing protein n=1 Tax=Fictibacillus TaxID=1329200 RepID=UPI00040B4569|nr:ATP-binding cassette domain-containing protein [Fictibacillus gelatini]
MTALVIDDVVKKFGGKLVLDRISLQIKGTFGLLGPNGAGKTTLMRMISTLESPDQGKIQYGDLTWERVHDVKKQLGYLPQHFSIYKSLNVEEVMNHFAVLKGVTEKEKRKEVINRILESVNLTDQKYKKVKNLSGGMLRRLGIAQALIGDPKIIIVDEPTAGLDIEERVRFCRLLRSLAEGRIIIISTHIVEDLESTCDNIAIIKKGKVLQTGTRKELAEITEGKVWEIEIPFDTPVPIVEENIISTKQLSNRYLIRFFSESRLPDAREVQTTLEDTYLYVTRKNLSYV